MIALTLAFVIAPLLSYPNVIGLADDKSALIEARTGVSTNTWFRLNVETGQVVPVAESVADVNSTGSITASTSFGTRSCGFAGSTCFVAASCSATFSIKGPSIDSSTTRQRTFVRLDRSGQRAWITQDMACPSLGFPAPAPLNGLYETATLKPIAEANGAMLANQRPGRRMITDRGQALTFAGDRLQWLDGNGARALPNNSAAAEAVTDAEGANVVYVEPETNQLHWIFGNADEKLNVAGTAPALTDDGRTLLFLGPSGSLQSYDRTTRITRGLGSEILTQFAVGTRFAFAVTSDDRIIRLDIASATSTDLLQPLPLISSVDTLEQPLSAVCPLICYGTLEPQWWTSNGSLLIVRGQRLARLGWRASIQGSDVPLSPYSNEIAAIALPSPLSRTPNTQRLELYHPDHPIRVSVTISLLERTASCLGTLHRNYDRLVSSADPVTPGETVHVYVTGLHDLVVPELADPSSVEVLSLTPAAGLTATQVLDVRVLKNIQTRAPLFTESTPAYACTLAPE